MKCQNPDCGQELDEGSAFCKYCGTPAPSEAPVEEASLTCPNPECGRIVSPGSLFCERCGTRIVPEGNVVEDGSEDRFDDWDDATGEGQDGGVVPFPPAMPVPAPGAVPGGVGMVSPSEASPAAGSAGLSASSSGAFEPPVSSMGPFGSYAGANPPFEPHASSTGAFDVSSVASGGGSAIPVGSVGQPAGAFVPADVSPSPVPFGDSGRDDKKRGRTRGVVVAVAAVVAVAMVGVGAFFLLRGGSGGDGGAGLVNPLAPPKLSEEDAADLAKNEAARIPVTHPSVSSDWIGEQTFVAGDMRVNNVYDPKSSASDVWVVDLTQTYESDAVAYERTWELSCGWDKDASSWKVYSMDDLGADDPRPKRGVTDEEFVAGVALLLKEAKPAPGNTDSHSLALTKCYSNGVAATVDGNLYDEKSETVKANVNVTGTFGLGTYRGVLATSLSWASSKGAFGWGVDSCVADAGAWKPDYAPLTVGTWNGTFVKTSGGTGSDCFGGRAHPATMVVKSVDSTAQTMVVDLAFVVHDHPWVDNNRETSDGDRIVEAHDVLVTFGGGWSEKVYTGDGFVVEMRFPSEGVKIGLDVQTESSFSANRPWRTDTYDMVRADPNPLAPPAA